MRTARTLRLATVLAATLWAGPARAGYTPYFSPLDVVPDPTAVLPSSSREAGFFQSAAGRLGAVTAVDLGGSLGALHTAAVGGGLSITLGGAKADPLSLVTSGVVSTNPNAADGFNVSSTAGAFLRLTPDATNTSVTQATADFTFAKNVQAFGVYLTGLGTSPGSLEMRVFDGGGSLGYTSHLIPADPSGKGGAQFVGFTDPGAGVSQVEFVLTGFSPTHRDIVGFDGISFVATPAEAVPEPPTSVLAVLGILLVVGSRYAPRLRGR